MNPRPLPPGISDVDLCAFSDGLTARSNDDETGDLTDNPHTIGSLSATSWYRGYNYDDEHPEALAEIRAYRAPRSGATLEGEKD